MLDKNNHIVGMAAAEVKNTLEDLQRWGVDGVHLPSEQVVKAVNTDPGQLAALPEEPLHPERQQQESLDEIRADLGDCQRCPLSTTRKNLVFGAGNPKATLVFVGEGPGRQEDEQGVPFVGEAGLLLNRILFAMGLERADIYICNVIKCRPPQNRNPEAGEIAACEPFLRRQIDAIKPDVLVALGKFAAQTLLQDKTPISKLRGKWHSYNGVALMPTFHPAYLLRNPGHKREIWQDMKQVMQRLEQNNGQY